MPEPLLVRSITYAPGAASVVHAASLATDNRNRPLDQIDVAPGYTVNPGTYLHRDDVVTFLRSMADDEETDADAQDALRDAARQLATRGQTGDVAPFPGR